MSTPRPRRGRLEAVAVAVLAVTVGAVALLGEIARPGSARSVEDVMSGVNHRGLTCLKDVVEGSLEDTGGGGTPEEARSLEEVAAAVEELRGLRFEEIPDPIYLDPRTLAGRAASYAEEYPDEQAWAETQILAALGAVEPFTDLKGTTAAAIEDQVAGFYDPVTGDLVIARGAGEGASAEEEAVLAHELVHALVDQALGLPELSPVAPGGEDGSAAALALAEGDATLAMSLYSSDGIFAAAASVPFLTSPPVGEPIPYFLQRSFTFPYAEGLGFVCHLYRSGGWQAVDAAYASPPTTTAEILFPERYVAGDPARAPREASPSGWAPVATRSLGAADLLFLFEAPGNDPRRALDDPLGRVAAWDGGQVRLWRRGDDRAVSVLLVQEGDDLCVSVRDWYRAAFPGDRELPTRPGESMAVDGERQDAVLRCGSGEVRLGIGPDVGEARDLLR